MICRIFIYLFKYLFICHGFTMYMIGITERTFQITTGKTNKYSRCSGKVPFSLYAVKYLIYLFHTMLYYSLTLVP
ncbi:hypothetical protein EZS27_009028 [termite gut metagenome]|uniref:Uncharacterized protein n=1 Tax=termite gut metagenome TaxID=433724 RepID=A0A5J4SBY5_9ZZZZ